MAKLPGLSRLAVEDCRKLVDDTCGTCKAHMTDMQISADGEALPWEPHENSKVVSIVVCFFVLFFCLNFNLDLWILLWICQ